MNLHIKTLFQSDSQNFYPYNVMYTPPFQQYAPYSVMANDVPFFLLSPPLRKEFLSPHPPFAAHSFPSSSRLLRMASVPLPAMHNTLRSVFQAVKSLFLRATGERGKTPPAPPRKGEC